MTEKVFLKHHGGTFAKCCKHYDGIDFTDPCKSCKAGVVMQDVIVNQEFKYRYDKKGTVYTSGYSMPCFRDDDPLGVCQCDKREFPTDEEVENEEKKIAELIGRTLKARVAIMTATHGKRGVSGSIPCPVCSEGTLQYSVAQLNGHIHARCTKDDCVSWME